MKELEGKNKSYAEKHKHLVSECIRTTERNTVLSKLINCLTSMLAIQGENARELPSSDTVNNTSLSVSTRGESMKAARRLLLDSLKALKFNTPELFERSKQTLVIPQGVMLPIEETKSPKRAQANPSTPFEMSNEFSENSRSVLEQQEYYEKKDNSDKKAKSHNNIL